MEPIPPAAVPYRDYCNYGDDKSDLLRETDLPRETKIRRRHGS